jgi:proline iminopeptidase
VADIEKLREHLGIERWVVFGGSWGSTLALAYAETHPKRVKALVLRGIFMLRRSELDGSTRRARADSSPTPGRPTSRRSPSRAQGTDAALLHSGSRARSRRAHEPRAAWSIWEGSTSKLYVDSELVQQVRRRRFADAFARIECHYFVNRGFLERDDQLLRDVKRIRHIPA